MRKKTLPLLKNGRNESPHVVILGAGASLASLPNGDKYGRKVPLMNNIVEMVSLQPILDKYGIKYTGNNFESFYDDLANNSGNEALLQEIEEAIHGYFGAMELPDSCTLYDYLVLSLREKDIIATFNWDPFLAQAFQRNMHVTHNMPKIAFLHGNVSVGCCIEHEQKGFLNGVKCGGCNDLLRPTKLLYPVKKKNYQNDEFIQQEWEGLRRHIRRAYIMTIFGYSAPATDVEAIELMLEVWKNNTTKSFSMIHIIDIKDEKEVEKSWKDFTTWSFSVIQRLQEEYLFRHPRRSCDAFAMATLQQCPWQENRFPEFKTLSELHNWIKPLIKEEEMNSVLSSKGTLN